MVRYLSQISLRTRNVYDGAKTGKSSGENGQERARTRKLVMRVLTQEIVNPDDSCGDVATFVSTVHVLW